MRFIADTNPTFWWPVEVTRPDPEKSGQVQTDTLEILFEMLSQDEALEFDEQLRKAKTEREQAEAERKRIKRVCRDWREVVDEKDKPIPFSGEMLDRFIQFPWNRIGIYRAFTQAAAGEAREKNS
jgi:hypothetical protein